MYHSGYLVVAIGNTVYSLLEDKVIWKCEFDHYLFGLSKLDVNNDGTDEVVVVSTTTGQVCALYIRVANIRRDFVQIHSSKFGKSHPHLVDSKSTTY